uniref:Uncharacterized protein n=1 Tax=Arundo donax TaxID=35708 RepID=A0A0A9FD80_ARUDO
MMPPSLHASIFVDYNWCFLQPAIFVRCIPI